MSDWWHQKIIPDEVILLLTAQTDIFVAGDVKLIQLATFFAEIDKVLKEYREKAGYQLPLVICGDFNSTPFSPLFDFITKGKLYYEGKKKYPPYRKIGV